jgi:excisionase family DNA binding protein
MWTRLPRDRLSLCRLVVDVELGSTPRDMPDPPRAVVGFLKNSFKRGGYLKTMPPRVFENLVSGPELALRLGVSLKTIERWVRQRIVPNYRLGRRCVRFDTAEVREALAKFQRPALRRLPTRGIYRPKPRVLTSRHEAQQLDLRFTEDPCQLGLPLAIVPPVEQHPDGEPLPE